MLACHAKTSGCVSRFRCADKWMNEILSWRIHEIFDERLFHGKRIFSIRLSLTKLYSVVARNLVQWRSLLLNIFVAPACVEVPVHDPRSHSIKLAYFQFHSILHYYAEGYIVYIVTLKWSFLPQVYADLLPVYQWNLLFLKPKLFRHYLYNDIISSRQRSTVLVRAIIISVHQMTGYVFKVMTEQVRERCMPCSDFIRRCTN